MIRKQSYMDYLSNPTSQLIWISNSCRQTDKLNFFWTINYLEKKKWFAISRLHTKNTEKRALALEIQKHVQSLPKLYREKCHLNSVLHLKQSHQREEVHFLRKQLRHYMKIL